MKYAHKPLVPPAPLDNTQPIPTPGPQFGEPITSPDPTAFTVKHASDKAAYSILDKERGKLPPVPFPLVQGVAEPILNLADVYGPQGAKIVSQIQNTGQIVFHSVGDTGNIVGPRDQNFVSDKMVSDYDETNPHDVPSFFYHLGDVVYSFGEDHYYYDQFYDAYRDYPAPIFAIPGNHDGMVAPNTKAIPLDAFLRNFCAAGQNPHRNPEAGQLVRTAQIQPGVYFTLEAPFVRILGLYSNCLEDPGVISTEGGVHKNLTDAQLVFLNAALARVKKEKFAGAVLIAVHHPPYVAATGVATVGKHGGNPRMLKDIDSASTATGVWPHAVLAGHAHNYQRFTRQIGGNEIPYIVAGNGGHAVAPLTKKGTPALRVPSPQPSLSNGSDTVVFESYDDQDFGYLRIIVNANQLRIEYHPAPDGQSAKTPDDSVTVDLKSHKRVPFQVTSGSTPAGGTSRRPGKRG
jgi:hypothetical protein